MDKDPLLSLDPNPQEEPNKSRKRLLIYFKILFNNIKSQNTQCRD